MCTFTGIKGALGPVIGATAVISGARGRDPAATAQGRGRRRSTPAAMPIPAPASFVATRTASATGSGPERAGAAGLRGESDRGAVARPAPGARRGEPVFREPWARAAAVREPWAPAAAFPPFG